MKITALEPQEHHPERVNVYVDGAFRCGLAVEIACAGGLHVGDEIDEEALAALERRDLFWKAREAALGLLSYRARTEAELRRRLLRKQYPEDVVHECVEELVERGLVDDAAFAASFVRDRVRGRPRGARRLAGELRARGVGADAAAEAVDRALAAEAVSELDLAREAARAWARRAARGAANSDGPWAARRRLYGFLARRGFDGDVIRSVMDEVLRSGRD